MARIDAAWAALLGAIDAASLLQLVTKRGADGWSAKDHLAHVATWSEVLLASLERRPLPWSSASTRRPGRRWTSTR
jgi:hypothetical protein